MSAAAVDIWDMPFDAKVERRASVENPTLPLSSPNLIDFLGLELSGVGTPTPGRALEVPAWFAGVNFLSGALAGLPLQVFKRTKTGREKVAGGIANILARAVNDDTTSFMWRKATFDQTFTEGRSYSWVEKNPKGEVVNIWPLEYSKTTPMRIDGRKVYRYRERGKVIDYAASEIIDIPMMLKPNGVEHYRPTRLFRETFGLAIAVTRYGTRFFNNGGVPPFTVEGPFQTAAGREKAERDLTKAIAAAGIEGKSAVGLPGGHSIKPLGFDPSKMQMVDVQRFLIEQIARILSLPMVFLQDLTRGTFSNTEQQDLHLIKHTLRRWIEQFEQELNLKIFGRDSDYYVRFNLDGLMRGAFTARMEGLAKAIQNAILTPNEARELEERESAPFGDDLLMQGATIPLKNSAKAANDPPPKADTTPPKEPPDDDAEN